MTEIEAIRECEAIRHDDYRDRRIAELEAALRRAIACIEHMRPMVMWDGIEGDQDDGDVAVTLMMLSEALKPEEEGTMWRNADRDWPDLGVQVVGISRSEGYEDLAFWTRTDDGWYVSDKNGSLGNRDAVTKERSRGPSVWCHAPKIDKAERLGRV